MCLELYMIIHAMMEQLTVNFLVYGYADHETNAKATLDK